MELRAGPMPMPAWQTWHYEVVVAAHQPTGRDLLLKFALVRGGYGSGQGHRRRNWNAWPNRWRSCDDHVDFCDVG